MLAIKSNEAFLSQRLSLAIYLMNGEKVSCFVVEKVLVRSFTQREQN